MNDTKISPKMKDKGWLSKEKLLEKVKNDFKMTKTFFINILCHINIFLSPARYIFMFLIPDIYFKPV